MRKSGKLTGMCRALLLAASVTALTVGAASAQQDLESLNEQILANPNDAELNFRYARAAEEAGQLRLALAAYERVMINDPENEVARRGYERIRRMIEPDFTTFTVEVGARWDDNARNSDLLEEEAWSAFVNAVLVDERVGIADRRWRSIVNFEGELVPDIDELDYAYLGAQTGPLFYAGPHLGVIPSIGVGTSILDGEHYFNEANLGLTIEGKNDGMSYWTRLRGGYRKYSDNSAADEGVYAEAIGGLSIPRLVAETDTLVLLPWVRWSDIEGSTFFFGGEIAPAKFTELGLEATYHYQVNDHLILSAGATVRERWYSDTTVFFSTEERNDTYVAPEVSMLVQNFAPCECGIEFAYRYRDNDSNEVSAEFEGNEFEISWVQRF